MCSPGAVDECSPPSVHSLYCKLCSIADDRKLHRLHRSQQTLSTGLMSSWLEFCHAFNQAGFKGIAISLYLFPVFCSVSSRYLEISQEFSAFNWSVVCSQI